MGGDQVSDTLSDIDLDFRDPDNPNHQGDLPIGQTPLRIVAFGNDGCAIGNKLAKRRQMFATTRISGVRGLSRRAAIYSLVVFAGLLPELSRAQGRATAEGILAQSDTAFRAMSSDPNHGIPRWVLEHAVGVVIFPDVKKAGFMVGGSFGRGVLLARRGNAGWSGPAFYNMTALSYGYQAGIQSADIVLVIMTRRAFEKFLNVRLKLGNDTAVAIGPVGAKGSLINIGKAEVLSYARARGLFAGMSMQGSAISYSDDMTSAYYGRALSSAHVLYAAGNLPVTQAGRHLMAGVAASTKKR